MSKNITKKIFKVCLWSVVTLITVVCALLTVAVIALSPQRLTPVVESSVNGMLDNAECKVGRVELTVWKTFPDIVIDMDSLVIVSHSFQSLSDDERAKLPADADTLLVLPEFSGGINLAHLFKGEIMLSNIMAQSLKVNAVAYSPAINNWTVVDTTEQADESSEMIVPNINVNSVELTRTQGVRYFDLAGGIDARLDILAAQVASAKESNVQFIFDSKTSFVADGDSVIKSLPVSVNGLVGWNGDGHFALKDWIVKIAGNPLRFSMSASLADSLSLGEFEAKVDGMSLESFLPHISDNIAKTMEMFKTNASPKVGAKLTKPYLFGDGEIPSLAIAFALPDCYVVGAKGRRLDNVSVGIEADIKGDNLDRSEVRLKNFNVSGGSINISLAGKAEHLVSNPRITGALECNADIRKALEFLGIPLQYEVSGGVNADTKIDFTLADISKKNYRNIGVHGNIDLKEFSVSSASDTLNVYADYAHFDMGSKEKFKDINNTEHKNLLRAKFTVDSLAMNVYGTKITMLDWLASAGINSGNYNPEKSPIIPMGGRIKARKVEYVDVDSSKVHLSNIECVAVSKPTDNSKLPTMYFDVNAGAGFLVNHILFGDLKNTRFNMVFKPRVAKRGAKMQAIIDSLTLLYPDLSPDSVLVMARAERRKMRRVTPDRNENSVDLSVDTEKRGILSKWTMGGSLVAEQTRVRTRYFPVKNSIDNIDIRFSLDSIIVNSGEFNIGRSSMGIKGSVKNIRTNLLGRNRKPLTVRAQFDSDTLDVNEIVRTFYAGTSYINSGVKESITEAEANGKDYDFSDVDTDTVQMEAFVIPANIDIDAIFKAKSGFYSDLNLSDMGGEFRVGNGSMQFDNLRTRTDAGSILFNALYNAPDKQNIHFALDMDIQDMRIDKFVKMMPAVDSLMPLLHSMSGIIDAEIAATSNVDSMMNVDMKSLNAAVKLRGDSLVLFDSETFKTISKLLLFKNKQRNMIDNMEVQIAVKDNVMQLYPFMFNMDRYKIGIMGSNDFAMNLDYHISVLKSPIPFKFGLNIKGTADNMKFRLGGAKFKEGQVATVTSMVDAQRINLRREMNRAFKRGARAALRTDDLLIGDATGSDEKLSAEDSLKMIRQGLIKEVDAPLSKDELKAREKARKRAVKEARERRKREEKEAMERARAALRRNDYYAK